MKRISRIFLLAIMMPVFLMVLLPMVVLADMDPPDSAPTMIQLKVYRNLLESGDRLFVAYFNNPYGTIPDDPANKTYIWELIDDDGTTVLGSTTGYSYVYSGYGYQVISLYFDASDNVTWDPATNYTLKLRGNPTIFDSPPVYNFPVSSSDYSSFNATADEQIELATDIIAIADELDGYWGLTVSLLSDDEAGQYLSYFGQGYFRGCIYSIQSMAPDLFPLALQNIDIDPRAWTDLYVTELYEQNEGTWIQTAIDAFDDMFDTDFNFLGLFVTAIATLGIAAANIWLTGDQWNGLVDASFIAIILTRIGMFGLTYLSLVVVLAAVFIAIKVWGFARA